MPLDSHPVRRALISATAPLLVLALGTAPALTQAAQASPVATASGALGIEGRCTNLPVPGPITRAFDPPAHNWDAGHRGVDVGGLSGTTVKAPCSGTVTYAQTLAGRPVLVVTHGATRETFEPVEALVPVGARVSAGQPIGRLLAGHLGPAPAVHWGLKRGDVYLNPLTLLPGEVRLLSDADAGRLGVA